MTEVCRNGDNIASLVVKINPVWERSRKVARKLKSVLICCKKVCREDDACNWALLHTDSLENMRIVAVLMIQKHNYFIEKILLR